MGSEREKQAVPEERNEEVRELVRERYAGFATAGSSCCGPGSTASTDAPVSATGTSKPDKAPSCGCGGQPVALGGPSLAELGYSPEQAAAIPDGADLGLGCGNPLGYAEVKPGETVLDLGSGAGIDAFLASREVGPTGRVIGVDMTPAMLERARANARAVVQRGGLGNVEFRLGEIEHLPLADSSVDVIISNCVVNLSPEKAQVFREALRVLRPGGRMLISDLVWLVEPSAEVRASVDALVGCVAGASLKEEYLGLIRGAGFESVEVVAQSGYGSDMLTDFCGTNLQGKLDAKAIASVKVRAVKPRA